MSKQAKNKENQQYDPKPIFPMCSNCIHYKSDLIAEQGFYNNFTAEKNIRCGIGGFSVKKQGTCSKHQQKPIDKR